MFVLPVNITVRNGIPIPVKNVIRTGWIKPKGKDGMRGGNDGS